MPAYIQKHASVPELCLLYMNTMHDEKKKKLLTYQLI